MRKLLIGAGAVALLIACSSSDGGDLPQTVTGTGGTVTGTGGDMGVPGTGGAVGYVGTGGDPMGVPTGGALVGTGGDPGVPTGGDPGVPTGGVPPVATGGVPPVATGGVPPVATGGLPPIATGGLPPIATGGLPPVATGGLPSGPTGGVSTANTGGLSIIGNTGGSGDEDTGGTDAGDDDAPADDDDTPEVYPDEFTVNSNGFCTQKTLSGYAWTNDTDGFGEGFEEVGDAGELCASGTVPTTDDYSAVGMIGWNIGQNAAGDDPERVELSGTITVTYKNAGGTPLRLQIAGAKEYCIDLSGISATAKTETFDVEELVVECWEGGNQSPEYGGEGIESIQLMAPGDGGDAGEDRDVDMCLVSVEVSM